MVELGGRIIKTVVLVSGILAWVAGTVFLMGCAYTRPQVIEFEGLKARVVVADDDVVAEHCWNLLKRWERKSGHPAVNDDGTRVTKPPPCCVRPATWWGPATAFVPRSDAMYKWCALHEICHLAYPDAPARCAGVGNVK